MSVSLVLSDMTESIKVVEETTGGPVAVAQIHKNALKRDAKTSPDRYFQQLFNKPSAIRQQHGKIR